jgi:hypothetical protein
LEFAVWAEDEEAILHSVWFSDVVYLHMHGIVSIQNVYVLGCG